MEIRKFRQGDRVHHKNGGPVMEVVRYASDHGAYSSKRHGEYDVVCVWFDEKGNRRREVFNQRCLYKLEADHGLYSMKN